MDRFTPQSNLTGIRLIDAGQNLHERGLARAILADQRMDFHRATGEGHVVLSAFTPGKLLEMPIISKTLVMCAHNHPFLVRLRQAARD